MAGRTSVGNLPVEMTSFIGRRRELGEIKRLVAEARLVTLFGTGGTGKTRLALQAAAQLRRAFPDGVWFVDLTEMTDPGLLALDAEDPDVPAELVAATLGLHDHSGVPPLRRVADHLADRQALLILDNSEHLLPACAVLVDRMGRACTGLRILATSREPLAVAGEVLFAVPPLPTPRPGDRPSLAELGRYEAVTLFTARAQAVEPGFDLTADNQAVIAELCHRLDGLPLAIELAAARIRVLAPRQMLDRLTDRFTLLSRGNRNAPARQQTLRACMDWSVELCSEPERLLWARVSVFAGGFELDAVEGICADESLPARDLLDLVTGLVDKSILLRESVQDSEGEWARYRMLESIRDYGRHRLNAAEELPTQRRRHHDWHQRLLTRASAEWISDRQAYWYARLNREYPNLRAAIEFSLAAGRASDALLLVTNLPRGLWWSQAVVSEARAWLDRALAQPTAPARIRARALALAGHLAMLQDDADIMTDRLAQAQGLAQRLDDRLTLAYVANVTAQATLMHNDLAGTIEAAERGLVLLPAGSGPELNVRLDLLLQVGLAAGLAGRYDQAERAYQEILEVTERRGERCLRSYAMMGFALAAWRRGDSRQAGDSGRAALRIQLTTGSRDPLHAALTIETLAWVAAARQRHRQAATLLGATETLLAERGTPMTMHHMLVADHAACERQVRAALGDTAFAEAFRRGQALTRHDALAYALDERSKTTPPPPKDSAAPLTRREGEVADLIAEGLSNKEIASRLVIAQRTAESHVEHILTKLGFTSRSQAAAWKAAQQSAEPT